MPSTVSGIVLKISFNVFVPFCFQVKSVLSDPKNGFNSEEDLHEKDAQKLEEVGNFLWLGNYLNSTWLSTSY